MTLGQVILFLFVLVVCANALYLLVLWLKIKRKNKYNAKRTADGFPSKFEAAVFQILLLRERAGEIRGIRRQHCVDLGYRIRWKIDFSFTDVDSGRTVFAEAKGFPDQVYKMKLKMYRNGAGEHKLEIWKGTWRKPYLAEVFDPAKGGAVDTE
jgi:hypothetical protein